MIVVVGCGMAGYLFVKEFRKLDDCTPITMITACDGNYYSKPQLSTALARGQSVDDLVLASADAMQAQLNVRIVTRQTVSLIDLVERTVQLESESIAFDRLVLATGATPIQPELAGDAVAAIHSVNSLEQYAVFRDGLDKGKRIAVIGSGLVGCEMMNDLVKAGLSVDMFSLDQAPLAHLVPHELGNAFKVAYEAHDVKWFMGSSVTSANYCEDQINLLCDGEVQGPYDAVLSAVGLKVESILADQMGLAFDRGICVDRTLSTSCSGVYALGDCARVNGVQLQYVAPLLLCARQLAQNLAGSMPSLVSYPAMPVVVKTSMCPVVCLPPIKPGDGQWRISGNGLDLTALCYDKQEQLLGFALMGDAVKEKMTYLPKLTFDYVE